MRRCPEEDDEKQHDRLPPSVRATVGNITADDSPADHDRHAAGRAAPDDVLPGLALEPLGVDEDVEPVGQDDEERGQPGLAHQPQPQHRQDQQRPGENSGAFLRHRVADQRAGTGAPHLLVNVVVGDHVERVRRTGPHPATEEGSQDEQNVDLTTVRLQHCRDGGDQQELNDPRLRQREIRLDGLQQILLNNTRFTQRGFALGWFLPGAEPVEN